MIRFDYVRPATVQDAIAAASEPGAAYLAAGTNLLDLMKGGVARPTRLVDITHLPGLDQIEDLPDGGVRTSAPILPAIASSPGGSPQWRRRFCQARPPLRGTAWRRRDRGQDRRCGQARRSARRRREGLRSGRGRADE